MNKISSRLILGWYQLVEGIEANGVGLVMRVATATLLELQGPLLDHLLFLCVIDQHVVGDDVRWFSHNHPHFLLMIINSYYKSSIKHENWVKS